MSQEPLLQVRYKSDGYDWKKRKDGKNVREDHMKLKVNGIEVSLLVSFLFKKCCSCHILKMS